MSANVYDTLSEKQRKEMQEAIDAFKEGAFDIHTYIRSFEPTNELQIGIYEIPKDCRAVVLEGGRQIEIKKKKNIHDSLSFRCKHCKHYVSGHTNYYAYTSMVCDAKPKTFSKWTMRQKEKSRFYDPDIKFYRGAKEYGKPCEMFEVKEDIK